MKKQYLALSLLTPVLCPALPAEARTYDAAVVLEDDGQYANFKLEFDQRKGGSR